MQTKKRKKSLNAYLLDEQPDSVRKAWTQTLTEQEALSVLYDWNFWTRPEQLEPEGSWRIWFYMAGRGAGKTRAGAEWIRKQIERPDVQRVALVGRTAADVRDTMIYGPSGLMAVFPPHQRPKHIPSLRRIEFYNGKVAKTYSAEEPDQLRGPAHAVAWCDEVASWTYPEAFENLEYGLREGDNPRIMISSTPRTTPFVQRLVNDPDCVVTHSTTYANEANLPDRYIARLKRRYEGSVLAEQEIYGKIIEDDVRALWKREWFAKNRVANYPSLARIVIGVDPAVTSGEDADDTGIVAAGIALDGNVYVLADETMPASKPVEWATQVASLYHRLKADIVVAEVNQGGELVMANIRALDRTVPVRMVRATRNKQTRAEPVSTLYAQDRVRHVGYFAELEDQLCHWVPGQSKSPDRMDALVWAITELTGLSESDKITTDSVALVFDAYEEYGGMIGAFDGL